MGGTLAPGLRFQQGFSVLEALQWLVVVFRIRRCSTLRSSPSASAWRRAQLQSFLLIHIKSPRLETVTACSGVQQPPGNDEIQGHTLKMEAERRGEQLQPWSRYTIPSGQRPWRLGRTFSTLRSTDDSKYSLINIVSLKGRVRRIIILMIVSASITSLYSDLQDLRSSLSWRQQLKKCKNTKLRPIAERLAPPTGRRGALQHKTGKRTFNLFQYILNCLIRFINS